MAAESVSVEYDPTAGFKPTSSRASAHTCRACGIELEDRRKTYHDECKPAPGTQSNTTLKAGGRLRTGRKTKVSDATHKGMTSIAGKLLYIITLYIAWSQLRGIGVPDPSGDIADSLAMTDEEAEIVGRPLARIFLSTEGGRRVAPKLVEHEDSIDAVFALWGWYQRSVATLDEYKQANPQTAAAPMPAPQVRQRTPRRPRERGQQPDATTKQTESDREQSKGYNPDEWNSSTYIPPSPVDLIGL